MSEAYTSNLTRDQFELIEPLLPPAKPGGRPRSVCLWAVLNAILYLVKQGCSWRDLPSDFPASGLDCPRGVATERGEGVCPGQEALDS